MHAFCILAHDDPALCTRLAARLAPAGPVFVHLDAKADAADFADVHRHAQVLEQRVPVYWGGWNMVTATLLLVSRALEDAAVDAVTLISGKHYPLMAPADIAAAPVRDRIRLIPSPDPSAGKPASRFTDRYVARFPPHSAASVITNAVARRLPSAGYDRVLHGRRLYAGSSWWSLSRRTLVDALAVLDNDPELVQHFRQVASPDESIIHTAVGTVLERREDLPAPEQVERETTFVSWAGGRHPEPLDADLIEAAKQQGWWFARKFSSARPDLIRQAEAAGS